MDVLKGLVRLRIDWIRMKLVRIGTAILYKDISVAFKSNESFLVIVYIIYSLFVKKELSRSCPILVSFDSLVFSV